MYSIQRCNDNDDDNTLAIVALCAFIDDTSCNYARAHIYACLHDCIWIPTLVHKCMRYYSRRARLLGRKSAIITFEMYISRRIGIRIRMEITLEKKMRMVNICKIEQKYLLNMIKKKNTTKGQE